MRIRVADQEVEEGCLCAGEAIQAGPRRVLVQQVRERAVGGQPPSVLLVLEVGGEAESLTRKAIEMAMGGDGPALRLCLDRIVPARKDRPVSFGMPKLETAADALKASTAIVEAVACGDLTPSEADELSRVVANFAKVAESADLAERIKRLEQMAENR